MSFRRSALTNRAAASDDDKKEKKEKDPRLVEIEQKASDLHKAFSNHYRGHNLVACLGPGSKVSVNYEDNGRELSTEPMAKRDYNKTHTLLMKAMDEVIKQATGLSKKTDSKQSKSRIETHVIKQEYEDIFNDFLKQMPQDIINLYGALRGNSEYMPFSVKLMNNMVRYYVYKNNLFEGAGKQTKEGKQSKSYFKVDQLLADLLSTTTNEKKDERRDNLSVGDVIQNITINARINHLYDDKDTPEDWTFPESLGENDPTRDDKFNRTNRFKRYNEFSDAYRKEWMSSKKKGDEYPNHIEMDAATAVLDQENIKLSGKPQDIIDDKSLKSVDPALYYTASIDFIAEVTNDMSKNL